MQAHLSSFDRLVSELSRDERRQMLERIRSSVTVVEEPLSRFHERPKVDLAAELQKLSFIQRVWLLICALLNGRNRVEVIEQFLIKDLGREIQKQAPGLIDLRGGTARALLYEQLETLRNHARVFRVPLSRAVGSADSSFYAFLCGFEMPQLQNQLEEDTDAFRLSAAEPDLTEPELRHRVFVNLDYILESMPADGRRRMYNNAQALQSLYDLAGFPFDELLRGFQTTPEGEPLDCPFDYIRESLTKLAGIMVGMQFFPSARLIEALYLYLNQERFEVPGSQVEQELSGQVKTAADALNAIRSFTAAVPLPDLVRYMRGDINYSPKRTSGGEEWYSQVRRFWARRIERQYDNYLFAVKYEQLRDKASEVLSTGVGVFSDYRSLVRRALMADPGEPVKARFALSLGVVQTFVSSQFSEWMHAPMKNLLIDGQFYKDDNREEYARAFETLSSLESQLDVFRERLADTGDFGLGLKRITRESHTSKAYRANASELIKRVDLRAREIIRDTISALDSATEVLNGILYGEVGGKYDTLSNLGQIGGRGRERLMTQLDRCLTRCRETGELLREILQLEETAPETLVVSN